MRQKRSRLLAIGSCCALVKSGFVGINNLWSPTFLDGGEEFPKEQERKIHSAGNVSAGLTLLPQQLTPYISGGPGDLEVVHRKCPV